MHRAFFMLFLFVVNANLLTAQESLIFKIYETGDLYSKHPFFDDYFYSEIAYAKTERNTTFFNLRKNIKSIEENYFSDTLLDTPPIKEYLEFDENNCLKISYKGDSIFGSDWALEEYEYDQAQHLIHRRVSSERYGNFNYSWYTYDIRGYLTERIDSFNSFDVMYWSQAVFKYGPEYSKVDVEYFPLSDELFWSFENGSYDIKYDDQGRYVNGAMNVSYDKNGNPFSYFLNNGCGSNSALCIQVNSSYDDRGNVIEQIVTDMTTRNSNWSFSSHFKAKYDENNLMIEREELSVENNFYSWQNSGLEGGLNQPVSTVSAFLYYFDEQGNWIRKDIFLNGIMTGYVERTIVYY